jgi:hypothetical protein
MNWEMTKIWGLKDQTWYPTMKIRMKRIMNLLYLGWLVTREVTVKINSDKMVSKTAKIQTMAPVKIIDKDQGIISTIASSWKISTTVEVWKVTIKINIDKIFHSSNNVIAFCDFFDSKQFCK